MKKREMRGMPVLSFAVTMAALVPMVSVPRAFAQMATPETSRLFEKFVDPRSGVVSYLLKPGKFAWNQQGIYFTTKSMTDDGRFLVFDLSEDERVKPVGFHIDMAKTKAVVDFLSDEVIVLDGVDGGIPFLDVKGDILYYAKRDASGEPLPYIYRRELLADPRREIVCCRIPDAVKGGGEGVLDWFTHLTLTADRRFAFLEAKTGVRRLNGDVVDPNRPDGIYTQGLLELATGRYVPWGTADFYCNHGQINPTDPALAMCAWDGCWNKIEPGAPYPRIWLFGADGSKRMIPPACGNYATHERWTESGRGFTYCAYGTVYHDLASGRQTVVCPLFAAHAVMDREDRYVLYDAPWDGWWRGHPWRVQFWNRATGRKVDIYSHGGELCPEWPGDKVSRLHPDGHAAFACNDRYAISTFNGPDRRMNLMVTPVAQLIEKTSGSDSREVWDLSETVACVNKKTWSENCRRGFERLEKWLLKASGEPMRASGRCFVLDQVAPGEKPVPKDCGYVKIDQGRAFFWGDVALAVEAFTEHVPCRARVTLKDGTIWRKGCSEDNSVKTETRKE